MSSSAPSDDPIARVAAWLQEAQQSELTEPNAMTVASVDEDGQPSARVVLLRMLDERGFVFFTNLESRKGAELSDNPRAALCVHWDPLRRQVRARGRVEQVSEDEADAYWAGRGRNSQLGAWASHQSRTLRDRDELLERFALFEQRYPGEVPRPPHWSGLRIVPEEIELWTAQPDRLHVRELYRRDDDGWRRSLLFP
jgi:pyridoxamine 5'-phosphate oxidase